MITDRQELQKFEFKHIRANFYSNSRTWQHVFQNLTGFIRFWQDLSEFDRIYPILTGFIRFWQYLSEFSMIFPNSTSPVRIPLNVWTPGVLTVMVTVNHLHDLGLSLWLNESLPQRRLNFNAFSKTISLLEKKAHASPHLVYVYIRSDDRIDKKCKFVQCCSRPNNALIRNIETQITVEFFASLLLSNFQLKPFLFSCN